ASSNRGALSKRTSPPSHESSRMSCDVGTPEGLGEVVEGKLVGLIVIPISCVGAAPRSVVTS
ncbi:MAG: hypothetical protein KJN81_05615, partial [Acidimicrobiia bacterium]|nr:hypothetical protein [Acidimicrobiia bacterium]